MAAGLSLTLPREGSSGSGSVVGAQKEKELGCDSGLWRVWSVGRSYLPEGCDKSEKAMFDHII